MSALRVLAFSYLAAASAFVLALTLQAHPGAAAGIAGGWRVLADDLSEKIWQPALGFARQQDTLLLDSIDRPVRIDLAPPGPNDARTLAHVTLPPVRRPALVDDRLREPEFSASVSIMIAPDLPPDAVAPPKQESPAQSVVGEAPRFVPSAPLTPRASAARRRLAASLSPELMRSFDLFLYVSKASEGPLAQRMYVFRKQKDGLALAYDWAASTGREAREVDPHGRHTFTGTPAGYYELDPGRMYRRYRSYSWDQPMPHAMFFNWERQGLQTGLAIHAASGDDVAKLGSRASAGCVHLSPDNARTLFSLIKQDYAGEVPRFAYDRRTDTTHNDGALAHDRKGHLVMAKGYKVLIFIEDYGGDDVVAALF